MSRCAPWKLEAKAEESEEEEEAKHREMSILANKPAQDAADGRVTVLQLSVAQSAPHELFSGRTKEAMGSVRKSL